MDKLSEFSDFWSGGEAKLWLSSIKKYAEFFHTLLATREIENLHYLAIFLHTATNQQGNR